MDKTYEEKMVKSLFNKRIQERVIYELSSPKKRINALNRLCHDYKSIINERYLIEIQKPNSNSDKILRLLKRHGAGDLCYVISLNKDIDGKQLPLIYALEKAVGFGLPSLISCMNNSNWLVYFESEQEFGPPQRFIIKK